MALSNRRKVNKESFASDIHVPCPNFVSIIDWYHRANLRRANRLSGETTVILSNLSRGFVAVYGCQKKHKNSKPQSEMKTFSQRCWVALVEF